MHGTVTSINVTQNSAENKRCCFFFFQSRMFTTTSGPSWRKTREASEPLPSLPRPSTWMQLITQCGEPAETDTQQDIYIYKKKCIGETITWDFVPCFHDLTSHKPLWIFGRPYVALERQIWPFSPILRLSWPAYETRSLSVGSDGQNGIWSSRKKIWQEE